MDLVSLVITPVVESLMVPLKKHLGFFISSPKYVKDMEAKMKQLEDTARQLRGQWDTAVANTEVVPEHVEPWLKDVESMKLDEESIPKGAVGCLNVSKRYKVGKRSYDILKQIEDLETRESKIKFTKEKLSLAKVHSTSKGPSTSALVLDGTSNGFPSREVLFNDALKSLQPNNETQNMIALCGTGGVGKTTLMEQLKKAVQDSKMFDWVVKVVVGENNDAIALQRAIAEYIHEDLKETARDARADRLRNIFEGMSQQGQKKILVIMDDIWKEIDLKDVGLTSPLPKGFKLMLTSRFEYVCTRMGVKSDSIFRVRVLNDEEAKTLFFGIVGASILDGDDPELQKIGENIVKKCDGLPIALKTIANNLRYSIKDAWKEALSNLQHDDLQDLNDIVHKVFEISYNNLQREDDKALLLLSGLFPDDFDIPIEDLMRYGWGLNLFTNVHTLAEARRRTNTCVNNLIHANLLTESESPGCVKMHDLMRAFILSNFAKVKQALIISHDNMSGKQLTKDANESYERILLKCTQMSKFPIDFNYPNLSLLILMDGHKLLKFPEDIYERTKSLEVISYVNMSIPLLPAKFEHSSKLRTLCLRSCSLVNDDISLLGSLSNLEILSFVDCKIRRLPSRIGMLKKLKLLSLKACVDLCIDDGVLQNLSSLEELYMIAAWGTIRFTQTNCEELENLSQHLFALELDFFKNKIQPKEFSFKNLERFRISIGCGMDYVEQHSFRNALDLVADCEMLLECNISELFEKTEELMLEVNDMTHLENVSMHHSFHNLTVLQVSNCTKLTYLFTVAVASGLKKLERLIISNCRVMKTVIGEDSTAGVISFQKLKFIYLEDLPNMISFCENLIELPELVELQTRGLPNFTSIYPDSDNSSEMQSLLSKEVVIPKLQRLDISGMDNLKQLWPCQITKEKSYVSMLTAIRVRNCDNLVNLFPSNPLPLLNHLEELIVEECNSIEVLFNIDFESISGTWEYKPCKLRSIRVKESRKLGELWMIKGVTKSNILIDGFKGVESITVTNCPIFKSIFTPTTINFDLGALNEYAAISTVEKMNAMLEGEISEMDEHTPNATYSSYLLHTCHHLRHLALYDDERVEEVLFEMDSDQQLLLLPYLEGIRLSRLGKMSHVWKCNWNKFFILHHPPLQLPFQNLTEISLEECQNIKYLLSPHMAKYLFNLKTISVSWCGIEEVISRRDDENEEHTSSYQSTAFFPHLKTLFLSALPCLRSVDDGDTSSKLRDIIFSNSTNTIHGQSQSDQGISVCWSLCQYPKEMAIYSCAALSSLVPWYAVGKMKRLEDLHVTNCENMTEVFESEPSTKNVNEGSPHGGVGTTLTSPLTLKTNLAVIPQFSSLKHMQISRCHLLSYIFTFSTLESLKQLKLLSVTNCDAIQVIVKEENGTSSKDVAFPRLESLKLDSLPNLKGLFLGMNESRWPLLDDVMIDDCPQLKVFTSGESKTPKLKYIRNMFGKYCLEGGLEYQATFPTTSSLDPAISKGMPLSFHNLIEVNIVHENVGTVVFTSNVLLQLQKLEKINISYISAVKEVFEVVALEGDESQTIVQIPNLKEVTLQHLHHLKYIWKSNQWMVLEFPNLTTVSITACQNLEHVFTSSMVGSLMQLQDLYIGSCPNIEVVVKDEEKESDDKVNEIMLPRLKSLSLFNLQSLKGFCLGNEAFSLPALDTLQIKGCPAITVFNNGDLSTPELKVIDTSFGMEYVKPDLNSFIKTKHEEIPTPLA